MVQNLMEIADNGFTVSSRQFDWCDSNPSPSKGEFVGQIWFGYMITDP
jgi:hypothetical protein